MHDRAYFNRQFLQTFGEPDARVDPEAEVIERFCAALPEDVLDFWQTFGWGAWQDGAYRVCNPDRLQPAIDRVLCHDPRFKEHPVIALGYDGFGVIDAWDTRGRYLELSVVQNMLTCHAPARGERWLGTVTEGIKGRRLWGWGYQEVLKSAVTKAGPLDDGECYAFSPALVFDGLIKSPDEWAMLTARSIIRADVGETLETMYRAHPPVVHEFDGYEDERFPIYAPTERLQMST